MNRRQHTLLALSLMAPLCAAPVLIAQTDRGGITGKVTDPAAAVLPNATVVLKNEDNGVTQTTQTNGAGEYTFIGVNPGKYTVTVNHAGFENISNTHIQIDVGSTVETDVQLPVGNNAQNVEVKAQAQQLNLTNGNLGMVIEQKAITDLPLVYGNPYALEFLAAGVSFSGVNPNIRVYDGTTAQVSINGSALNSIDYKLDGAPDTEVRFSAFTPSTEMIAQYKLDTANYDATEGHSSGGFVNTSLKSGTNRIHGTLYGYYQDPKINANVWSTSPTNSKPAYVREGVDAGGPFLRDRAFWFFGFEHSRLSTPNVQVLTVPTAAERNGDFSALLAYGNVKGEQTCTSPQTLTTPNAYQIFDATSAVAQTTVANNTNYNRKCIPGNILPAGSISPIAKAALAFYPMPNVNVAPNAEGNYVYNAEEPDRYDAEVGRVDLKLSETSSLYGHVIYSDRTQSKNNWFPPVSGVILNYGNQGGVIGYTNALTPSTVLTAVAAYTRFIRSNVAGGTGAVTPATIGMASYLTDGLPKNADSLPRFDLTSYTSGTTEASVSSEDDIWMGNVTLARQTGTNFTRAGFEYRRYLTNSISAQGEQGQYVSGGTFSDSGTTSTIPSGIGFAVAQFEQGVLSSGSQVQNSDFAVRSDYYAGFVQNDWRATDKLTVNTGLRYELESPLAERNNKEVVGFNFAATNNSTAPGIANYAKIAGTNALLPSSINPVGGLVFAGTGSGHLPYSAPKYDFSPRLGFAYAFAPNWVVRGGYGIFFDSIQTYYTSGGNSGSTTTFYVPQQGFQATSNVAAPTFTNAGGLEFTSTLANPFPGGLVPVSGNSLGTSTALGQSAFYLDPHPHMPYNQRWSLGFERQLGAWIVSVDYVGNHGVHQPISQISTGVNTGGLEHNAIPVQYLSRVTNAFDQANSIAEGNSVTNPFYKVIGSGAANNLSSKQVQVSQLQRPYPEFSSINAYSFEGTSIYHAAQVQVQRRFTNGLSLTSAFTWSRTLDGTTYLNTSDTTPWYGVSIDDRPLRLASSFIYDLPFGRGRRFLGSSRGVLAQAIGGWQAQAVYQIQSGTPLQFQGNDTYLGVNGGDSHFTRGQYKKTVDPGSGIGTWFDTSKWLNVAAPASAANHTGTCATTTQAICTNVQASSFQIRTFPLRFNTLRSDNLNQADVGVQREFGVRRLGTLQFRAEAINMLNHPVYTAPSTDPRSTQFGQILSQANQPRVYQFAGFFRF